jgi:hypothetical protein
MGNSELKEAQEEELPHSLPESYKEREAVDNAAWGSHRPDAGPEMVAEVADDGQLPKVDSFVETEEAPVVNPDNAEMWQREAGGAEGEINLAEGASLATTREVVDDAAWESAKPTDSSGSATEGGEQGAQIESRDAADLSDVGPTPDMELVDAVEDAGSTSTQFEQPASATSDADADADADLGETREHLGEIALAGSRDQSPDSTVEIPPNQTHEELARDAVEDALVHPASDLNEADEQSDFQQKVAHSEAQDVLSTSEAEDYAREKLEIPRVDYSDFDQKTANEVNATLEVLRDKYPEVGGFEYLGTIQGRNEAIKRENPELAAIRREETAEPAESVAAVNLRESDGYNGITINREWASDFSRSTYNARKDEVFEGSARGTGSVSGIVAHEFGHSVENHLRDSGQFGEVQSKLNQIKSGGFEYVASKVSRYATSSDQELFAELFAEHQLNAEPREPAREVGEIVDRKLRQ